MPVLALYHSNREAAWSSTLKVGLATTSWSPLPSRRRMAAAVSCLFFGPGVTNVRSGKITPSNSPPFWSKRDARSSKSNGRRGSVRFMFSPKCVRNMCRATGTSWTNICFWVVSPGSEVRRNLNDDTELASPSAVVAVPRKYSSKRAGSMSKPSLTVAATTPSKWVVNFSLLNTTLRMVPVSSQRFLISSRLAFKLSKRSGSAAGMIVTVSFHRNGTMASTSSKVGMAATSRWPSLDQL